MSPASAFDLWTVPILSDADGLHAGKPELYLRPPAYQVYPSFSPDGRWLAYSTNESGTWQVFVRKFPDDGSKVRVSDAGGRVPRWSPNGQDLFYGTDDQRLMVVRYSTRGGTFVPGPPRLWAQARLADTGVLPNYDVPPDGKVVALIPAGSAASKSSENEVTVLTGFFEQLRQRRSASRTP
jgi:WD40 repeat protein